MKDEHVVVKKLEARLRRALKKRGLVLNKVDGGREINYLACEPPSEHDRETGVSGSILVAGATIGAKHRDLVRGLETFIKVVRAVDRVEDIDTAMQKEGL